MLTSLRIQNFRSIRDASVKLGQVNLFIGPNNSGKSNFLKGVELFLKTLQSYPYGEHLRDEAFASNIFRTDVSVILRRESISFFAEAIISQDITVYKIPIVFKDTSNEYENQKARYESGREWSGINPRILQDYSSQKRSAVVYKPDPSKFQFGAPITNETRVSADAGNLVSFIFFLSQNHKSRFGQLENDLARCIGNLVAISTPADPNPDEKGKLRLKFFDRNDIGYWADEVSEGVLYFLALLCIVHQPDPPKLLLLEEPEKGIHPRRIKEVMDFIFELARLRDIQIILTSHSPYVVDHFADIPECISVFDRENGETVIRNAGDIITETNEKLAAEGKKPIRYTDSLGEHWVSGFLGGVPV